MLVSVSSLHCHAAFLTIDCHELAICLMLVEIFLIDLASTFLEGRALHHLQIASLQVVTHLLPQLQLVAFRAAFFDEITILCVCFDHLFRCLVTTIVIRSALDHFEFAIVLMRFDVVVRH